MDEINIVIQIVSSGDELDITLDKSMTGIEIKEYFADARLIPDIWHNLFCKNNGVKINDNDTLEELNIKDGNTLYLVPSDTLFPEVSVRVEILPEREFVNVTLNTSLTGLEVKDGFVTKKMIANYIMYDLFCKDNRIEIKDNRTLHSIGIKDGYGLYLAPVVSDSIGMNINMIIQILSTGDEFEVELHSSMKSVEIIVYLEAENLISKEDEYNILLKREGVILDLYAPIFSHSVENNDTLILFPSSEEKWVLDFKEGVRNIPNEVISKGITNIREYLRRMEYKLAIDKPQPLNECKLIFIGAGGVGKTSLVNRIVGAAFNEEERKTDGIEITKWSYLEFRQKELMKVNIWDFGGQEIMHSIHKFFMTRRSIYVLVVNPRIQDQFSGDFELDYWLKLISSFGGTSPIIVAINKSDIHRMNIGRGTLTDRFPQIIGFVETSCKKNIGILKLTKMIEQSIDKLKHIKDVIPLNYLKIKEELENTNKDYIHYNDYLELCKRIAPDFSEIDSGILIGLLNDLGVMLNISQNRRLSNTKVLNPEWVTGGVYAIINSDKLISNKGIITEKEINIILDDELYPTDTERGFIMDMMSHFNLSYQIHNKADTYFIPGAFQKDKPNGFKWKYDGYIHFVLKYDILPNSIFSRFIVRKHSLIYENIYWRNGILLKEDNCVALVESFPFDRKIVIKISGEDNSRNLLTSIRKEFEYINESISKIKVESYVSLDENEDFLINYDDLLSYKEEGIEIYFEPKQKIKYNVIDVLNGIENKISVDKLKTDISEGKVISVINYLKLRYPQDNSLIVLLARMERLKSDRNSGVLERKEYAREENEIVLSLLELIDNLI